MPGDMVEKLIQSNATASVGTPEQVEQTRDAYARDLGYDKPAFYCAITSSAYPDTLHRILNQSHQESLRELVDQYGNWEQIEAYYQQILTCRRVLKEARKHAPTNMSNKVSGHLLDLQMYSKEPVIRVKLQKLDSLVRLDSTIAMAMVAPVQAMQQHFEDIITKATPQKHYLPTFQWYGFDNQYHAWMTGLLSGSFGYSITYKRDVGTYIMEGLRWTLLLNVISIGLAYVLSVPLGVYSAVHKDSAFDRVTTFILFALYSLPVFWMATMLLVFLTTSEYGMDWFPTLWAQRPEDASFWERFSQYINQLTLPIFCLTYTSLAFITRQMRGSVLNIVQEDYIRTARAKGLSERKITWKHIFNNSLSPIITMFANVFPATFAGSVIIERIFTIPGMGNLALEAILDQDWPVVYAVLMLGSILTMLGILIADILYVQVDPRVSFSKKK